MRDKLEAAIFGLVFGLAVAVMIWLLHLGECGCGAVCHCVSDFVCPHQAEGGADEN